MRNFDGFQVYWLVDTESDQPFYVGYTNRVLILRLQGHFSKAKFRETEMGELIASTDYNIQIVGVEKHLIKEDALKAEGYWINQLSAWGFKLYNENLNKRPMKRYIRKTFDDNGRRVKKTAA